MVSRSVNVDSTHSTVQYYDKTGTLQTLGQIVRDDFQGENLAKFSLVVEDNNPYLRSKKREENKPIVLGKVGSSKLDFVQPYELQQIFLDRGLEIADQYGTDGGTDMVTLFRNPSIEMPNIFEYDRKHWQGRHDVANIMYHGIELRTSIKVGSMAGIAREGLFVLVCTNGLMANVMKLPQLKVQHINFEYDRTVKNIDAMGFSSRGLETVRGPQVAEKQMLSAAYSAISRFRDDNDRAKQTDAKLVVKSDSPFYDFSETKMTHKLLNGYLDHLKTVLDNDSKIVYAGDIVNAYTSAVNELRFKQEDSLRGSWMGLSHTDAATNSTVQLAKLAGMFLDIDFKEITVEAEHDSENMLAELA